MLLVLVGLSCCPHAAGHVTDSSFARDHIITAHDAMTDDGPVAWFTVDDGARADPTIAVAPGESVLLIFVNAGSTEHTFAIEAPIGNTTGPVAPGEEAYLWFRVPMDAPAKVGYGDPAWDGPGMAGVLEVQGVQEQATPAPAAWLVLVAVSVAMRRPRGPQ